jgi:hypothetical protein
MRLSRLDAVVLGVACLPVAEEDEPLELALPPGVVWEMVKEGCLL